MLGAGEKLPFLSLPVMFPESTLHWHRLSMSPKDVIVDAGGKRDSGIPFAPGSVSIKNSSALRLSSASHRIFVFTKRSVTFLTLMPVNVVLSVRPGGQDLGRTRSAQRDGEEDVFGRYSPSRLLTLCGVPNTSGDGLSVFPVFSFVQPSKRTPICGGLEDGRRRWGGRGMGG